MTKNSIEWTEEGHFFYNKARTISYRTISFGRKKCLRKALAAYEQALHLDPNNSDAYYGKGDTLFELKSYRLALAAYQKCIDLNPKDIDAYCGKGETLLKLRCYKSAYDTCKAALYISRSKPSIAAELCTYMGRAHEAANYYDLAISDYRQALSYNPYNTVAIERIQWIMAPIHPIPPPSPRPDLWIDC